MATDGNSTGGRTMKASECKAKCLQLMDEVAESGTDKGRMRIIGDIVSPMPAEWFEDSDDSRKELF